MLHVAESTPTVKLSAGFETAFASFREAVCDAVDSATECEDVFDLFEVERTLCEAASRLIGVGLAETAIGLRPKSEMLIVGEARYRKMAGPSRGVYRGLHGPFEVQRHLYRQVGVHNGPTLDPIAARCGMVGGRYTPMCAAALGHLAQALPSRDAAGTAKALAVLPYGRCTFARGGTMVGELWEEGRDEAEQRLAEAFEVPEKATTVSVAVDRVSMPMAETREATAEDGRRGIKRPI